MVIQIPLPSQEIDDKTLSMNLVFIILTSLFVNAAPLKGKDLLTERPIEIHPKEKGTVVVFLSAKCPCSASHINEIKRLAAENPAFQFVGVHSNSNEGKELSQNYFKLVALNFPVLQDTGGKLANEFRASKTPHVFLLSPAGKAVYKGGVTDSKNCDTSGRNYLKEALSDLNQGKAVRTSEARTLGCAIARGESDDW